MSANFPEVEIGEKPKLFKRDDTWICRDWIDTGAGSTPQEAYLDMVIRSSEREWNRRCF